MPGSGGPWHSALDREHPLVGRLWDVRAKAYTDVDAVVDRARRARYLLLGEKHDDVDHHRLQALLVRDFLAAAPSASLVMEMIDVDQQSKVDEARSTSHDADAIGRALDWAHSGWPSFENYSAIVQSAIDADAPILGGDPPRAEVKGLFKGGAIEPSVLHALGLDRPLPPSDETSLEAELVAVHCGQLPAEMIATMALAQRYRDAEMASRMRERPRAVLIAGAGHVRVDRGAPWYLRNAGVPDGELLSLAFVEVEHGVVDPSRYDLPYDVVWFTPRANDDDPCGKK